MDMVTRIREELEIQNIKQKDIVEFLGENQSAVAKWLSLNEDIRNDMPNTILIKISQYLNVDAAYLVGLQEEKRVGNCMNNENYTLLPSYNVLAGAGAEGYLPDVLEFSKIPVSNSLIGGVNTEYLHIIQVAGDSMQPTIKPSDWLIIDMVSNGVTERLFEKVDGIYLISKDGAIQIKRLAFKGAKGVDIISDNTFYPVENTIEKNIDLVIIGKLYKHVQDLGALLVN